MTSKSSNNNNNAISSNNDEETLRRLLRDRIAQLESREEDPPRTKDEQEAEDSYQVAVTAARALVEDKDITYEEKVRVLQLMYTDCIKNVRSLEYDLGLEEKRLSVAELDYNELGEDLRKIDVSTEKLKQQSRELSKQNKVMVEECEKRTSEEKLKREEIVNKFDQAMNDINYKLNCEDCMNIKTDDLANKLVVDYKNLQTQYEKREIYYEHSLNEVIEKKNHENHLLEQEINKYKQYDIDILNFKKKSSDTRKQIQILKAELDKLNEYYNEVLTKSKQRQRLLKRQQSDMKKLQQSEKNVKKELDKLNEETEELKSKSKQAIANVKVCEEELEFWKAKSKSEFEKRETLERLCRTLTEERTIMRKEVQAMQAAWGMLEHEIENLRMEINEPDK